MISFYLAVLAAIVMVLLGVSISRYEAGCDNLAHRQPLRSNLSFALAAAVVCHCMLLGLSAPPQARALTWSTT
jgi:hypothetical protein